MPEKTDDKRVGGVLRDAASVRGVASGCHAHTAMVTLPPGAETGERVHTDLDETLVFLDGGGTAVVDGQPSVRYHGGVVFVPAGAPHNVRNTGSVPLRLYAVCDHCN